MSSTMVSVVPVFNFCSTSSGDSIFEITILPEVDSFAVVMDRSQPSLVFINPVNSTDAGGVVPFAPSISGVFGLRHRPQVLDSVIMADTVDMVDEVWVNSINKFPDYSVSDPHQSICAYPYIPFGVYTSCGFVTEDFIPRNVPRAVFPKQLTCDGVIPKDRVQFCLCGECSGSHIETPCDMGTSVIDHIEIVKELVWH